MSTPNPTTSIQTQLVPESILKRKHDLDELQARRAAQALIQPRGKRKTNKVSEDSTGKMRVVRPEKFVLAARVRKNYDTRFKRVKKKGMRTKAKNKKVVKTKVIKAEDLNEKDREVKYTANSIGAPFVFAIRTRDGRRYVPGSVKRTLERLRLSHLNEGIFIRLTPENQKMLHLVAPFVIYGIPSKAIVTDLINRRGHGKINNERIPLSDNIVIEQALGDETGILCVEDLVHEIYSVGENFEKAVSFLWPFRLAAPKTKFQKRILNEKDGKVYGDVGEEIEDFIKLVL